MPSFTSVCICSFMYLCLKLHGVKSERSAWSSFFPISRLASAADSGRTQPRNMSSPALHYYYSNHMKKLSGSGLFYFT